MTSDRIQRRLDQFLDAAEDTVARLDWAAARENAQAALALDPKNGDAAAFLAATDRAAPAGVTQALLPVQAAGSAGAPPAETPASFGNGRYQVVRFLGEGGKKRVYLAPGGSPRSPRLRSRRVPGDENAALAGTRTPA